MTDDQKLILEVAKSCPPALMQEKVGQLTRGRCVVSENGIIDSVIDFQLKYASRLIDRINNKPTGG